MCSPTPNSTEEKVMQSDGGVSANQISAKRKVQLCANGRCTAMPVALVISESTADVCQQESKNNEPVAIWCFTKFLFPRDRTDYFFCSINSFFSGHGSQSMWTDEDEDAAQDV